MKLSGHVMTKSRKPVPKVAAKDSPMQKNNSHSDIRFVVPMPGKGSWHKQPAHFSTKKICKFTHRTKNLAIEDFQAQFLMEREYPID